MYGGNDVIAPPDTVLLAHEIITPSESDNLIGVHAAGHVDLIIGENARKRSGILQASGLLKERLPRPDPFFVRKIFHFGTISERTLLKIVRIGLP